MIAFDKNVQRCENAELLQSVLGVTREQSEMPISACTQLNISEHLNVVNVTSAGALRFIATVGAFTPFCADFKLLSFCCLIKYFQKEKVTCDSGCGLKKKEKKKSYT